MTFSVAVDSVDSLVDERGDLHNLLQHHMLAAVMLSLRQINTKAGLFIRMGPQLTPVLLVILPHSTWYHICSIEFCNTIICLTL